MNVTPITKITSNTKTFKSAQTGELSLNKDYLRLTNPAIAETIDGAKKTDPFSTNLFNATGNKIARMLGYINSTNPKEVQEGIESLISVEKTLDVSV